ncbi:MAG: GNAT family N-acetyltransferase [Nannocystaceae bacterium]
MTLVELPRGADRARVRPLLELADDAPREVDAVLAEDRIFVLVDGDALVGEAAIADRGEGVVELRSLAIAAAHQGQGRGRALVEALLERLRGEGVRRVIVATAIAGLGVVRFYLRLGFRASSIERDAFTPERGYPSGLQEGGIPILDRIWFDLDLA